MAGSGTQSDLALMSAVAEQDTTAQAALVERLSARVLRVSRLLCRSQADAEDSAQLALLEILRSAERFRVEASLERWADRITARTALRVNKRERQRAQLLERWLSPGRFPWGTPLQAGSDASMGLGVYLGRLSVKRREAFILRHALEYSVEEIAELTGAPPGTVKDRLVNARKQLRRMLDREERSLGEGKGS
jgi:RNA polymerase sigma-70 factor (ECF subfamily)